MSKKVFVTRMIPENGLAMLRAQGYEVDVNLKDEIPSSRHIISWLSKKPYDALLSLLTDEINGKVFDAAPNLKIVSNYAVGFNNIDVKEAKKRGIVVTNTQGNYSNCIAEHAVALMLDLCVRMSEADRYVRAGKFDGWSPMHLIGTDLKGKTIGLIGVGHIGFETARIMNRGFGSKIIYYDVVRNDPVEKEYGAEFRPAIEDVLKEADIVSIHVPLLESTHHLINEKRLKLMKPTALLINTSRGPVVDEQALIRALREKTIAGAGLDVYEFEPKIPWILTRMQNVVLTPHIASARVSAREEMAKLAAEHIIECLEGREVKGKVV